MRFRPSIFIRSAAGLIPSTRAAVSSFVWRLGKFHPPALPSLHSFGGWVNSIHLRISSLLWQRIPLPRRHLFIRPAASPRCHLFIISTANSIAALPSLHSAGSVTVPSLHSFGRRIDRRATIFSAGGESHRCAAIFSAIRRIPSPHRNPFSGPVNLIAAPQSFQRAGKSHCRTAIFSAGRRIPLPRNLFSGLANPITAQSFQRAQESHRRAAFFSAGRRIPSPSRNLFSGPANPIVSAGQRIPSPSRQISSRPVHHCRACCITLHSK